MNGFELPFTDDVMTWTLVGSSLGLILRTILVGGLCVLPAGILVLLARYELKIVSARNAAALFTIRLLVLAAVAALLLFQPALTRTTTEETPGRVVLLLDRSASMDLADGHRPATELLRLAKRFDLFAPLTTADRLDRWIADETERKPSTLLTPAEAKEPDAVRRRIEAERRRERERVLQRAAATTRREFARLALSGDALAALQAKHRIRVVAFDTAPADADVAALATAAKPDATTDLAAALEAVHAGGEPVLGVLLVSDGRHTAPGRSPLGVASSKVFAETPVYPVLVGSPAPPPGVVLASLVAPDHALIKDLAADFDAEVRVTGRPPGEYAFELRRDGEAEPFAKQTFSHAGKDATQTVRVEATLSKAGLQALTARVVRVTDANDASKSVTKIVSVTDERIRVLLVDQTSRWENHYLATALATGRNKLTRLDRVVFDQPRLDPALTPPAAAKLGLPAADWPAGGDPFGPYAVIHLGDLDPARVTPERAKQIEAFVADRGGTLIVQPGKNFLPSEWLKSSSPAAETLRRLLPVESPRELAADSGFALRLTPAGGASRYMELAADAADNATLWAGFPRPWAWGVCGKAKPAAVALATAHPLADPAAAADNVVAAAHNVGFGRVLFVGVDSTWRWRFRAGDEVHHRFWGQVMRWAASDRPLLAGDDALRFGTPRPVYRAGEEIDVLARFAETPANESTGAKILRLPDAPGGAESLQSLIPLSSAENSPTSRRGRLPSPPPGRYAAELVSPSRPGSPLRAEFRVLPPENRELVFPEADREALEAIAAATKGRVFDVTEIADAVAAIMAKTQTREKREEVALSQSWVVLGVIVLLLSCEWLLRKRVGLP